jgi:hypothetical protein
VTWKPSDWRAFVSSKAWATASATVALISIRPAALSNAIRSSKASNVWRFVSARGRPGPGFYGLARDLGYEVGEGAEFWESQCDKVHEILGEASTSAKGEST